MDVIQLLVTVAAVLGMIAVGLLAVIPTALGLRDVNGGQLSRPSMLKAVAEVSLGRTLPSGDMPDPADLVERRF